MRTLNYKLNDGTIVKTMAEAKASGKPYTEILTPVETSYPIGSELRKEMLAKSGRISFISGI